MTLSVAVIDVVADLLDEQLPPRLREALARIEAAERAQASPASPVTVGGAPRDGRQPSKGALRTRRWRAAKAARAAGGGDHVSEIRDAVEPVRIPHTVPVTASVTERHTASPEASHVTVGDVTGDAARQKKVPPHTPLQRKTTPTQKGFPKRRRRHRGDGFDEGAELAATLRTVFLDAHDARYREIVVIRQRSFPIHSGGWWFPADLVAEAEARLAAKVTQLRPVAASSALAAATGPPGRAAGSG